MFPIRSALLAALLLSSLLSGCATAPTQSSPDRTKQQNEARDATKRILDRLYAQQPKARSAIEEAAGYAVFHDFGMKVLLAGGGTGKGIAFDNTDGREIFMKMVEIQAGLGFGAKKYDLVWVFSSRRAFNDFVDKGFEIGGQATLAAKTSHAGGSLAGAVQVAPDVWVYQMTESGLAAELTVKGTRYYRDSELN